jgi:tetratricopeptide (TPR) repeat protein
VNTPATYRRPRWQLPAIGVLLFGLVAAVFLPALQNDFINYDDDVYVTGNPHVQAGLNAATVAWAFQSTDASNWHPLTWLSHMADCSLHGLDPRGHHLTSILFHAVNAVLLFLLLHQLTGSTWRSLFVATVFGVHPLRVESVAWVAERKDVLSLFFGLLAMMAYTRHARQSAIRHSPFAISYALALVFFALSLMSKPMLVTLPFVLLLLDYWPLGRVTRDKWQVTGGKLVMEQIPFFVLSAGSCVITFLAQRHGGAMVLMADQSLAARLENAVVSYGRYLGKLFWPENLAVLYPVVDHWPALTILAVTFLLLAVSAAALLMRRTQPYLMTGWFWYLGTLVPVLGLVAVGEQSMADRYTYFPMIGVLLILAWGVEQLTQRMQQRAFILAGASAAIVAACIAVTEHNLAYWKNSETLFRHVIAATGDNYSANCNLGNYLMKQGRMGEALVEFQTAVRLKPGSPENHCNLGVALANLDQTDEAIAAFQTAVRLNPDYGPAHHDLGMAFEKKEQLDNATREYLTAVRLMPDFAGAHNSLGVAYAKQNRLDDALMQFEAAVKLDPSFVPAQNNLKMALQLKQ